MNPRTFVAVSCVAALLAAGCATQAPSESRVSLSGSEWQLIYIRSMDGRHETTLIADPSRYTLALGFDGRATLRVDCNRGTGNWESERTADASGTLHFGPFATTRMACPAAALEQRILRDLATVRSYTLQDGDLHMSLMAEGGIYRWAPRRRKP